MHRDPLEAAGALDFAAARDRVARPRVERREVPLRLGSLGLRAKQHGQVVERAGAPLVAAQRELARGRLDGIAPRRPERALQRLARAHQIEAAAHRREAAIGRARLESLRLRAPSAAPRPPRGARRARSSPAR